MGRTGKTISTIAVVAAVALLSLVVLRGPPSLPTDAIGTPAARTILTGDIPAGQECLPRIEVQTGWMDACWAAYRDTADGDEAKDYYVLRVYSSFEGTPAGGVRWAVLKADLEGDPRDNVFEAWPTSTYEGACQGVPVSLMFVQVQDAESLCGHTEGTFDPATWTSSVTWTCESCFFLDTDTRALTLYQAVGVQQGTVPEWRIYANLGD